MIKSISLENWKSIKKSSTDLPSFCALVGENAAGKSNLIQSIKLIKVLVHGGTIEEFKVKGTEKFPLNYEQNRLALAYYKATDTDNIRNYFNNIIVPEFSDINNLNADILASNDPSSRSLANIIFDLIHNHPDVYAQFMQIVQKFMPLFKSFVEIPTTIPNPTNDPSKSKFLLVAEEENLKDTLSMLSLSDGDIRTLYLLATALRVNNGSTFIIEEIENGIHPNRVTRLIDQLNTISRVKNMQIIFTTHSSLVINEMSVSQIILVEKDKNTGTNFKQLDKVEQISGIIEF